MEINAINVLIINYYYPPIVNGGVQRTYNFKKYLSQMGFNVAFLTTSSFGSLENDEENLIVRYPDRGYDYTHSSKSSRLGVFIFRAWRLLQVKLGLLTDGKYYWKKEVVKNIDQFMNSHRFDVVIASYPTPANLEIGEIIYKRYGIPLIVDYRDGLMYEPFYEVQHSIFTVKHRLLSLEKRMAKIASLHLTVNPEMNQYYSDHYPSVKSVMIPNGFDDEEVFDCAPLKLPEGTNVIFTGSIGKSRKMYEDNILADFLNYLFEIRDDVNYIFIGDYKAEEIEIFKKHKNVFVYDKTDRNRVVATQRIADALLLISGSQGGTSGKLYEYLFSGKPILNIGGHTGIAAIIDDTYYGYTCEPGERDKIKQFIDKLKAGSLRFERGDLKPYTRRYQSGILAKEIREIINRH